MTKHGHAKHGNRSPEWSTWWGMISRCHSKTHVSYKNYGARGIKVCKEWREKHTGFISFLSDMGERPSKKYSLERLNNQKGYEPGNVIWALTSKQCYNKRSTVNLTYNGKTKPLSIWAKELGINRQTISYRLKHGKTVTQALKV